MQNLLVGFLGLMFLSVSAWAEVPFNLESFRQSQKMDKKILLHFHAEWCPTCKSQKKILSMLNSEGLLKDITVYTVDYDKESDFKKELKVTQQSTLVAFYGGIESGRAYGISSESDVKSFLSDKLIKLTLKDQLNLMKQASRTKIPPEAAKIMSEATDELKKSQISEKTLKVGQAMTAFSLPDSKGNMTSLKSLLKNGPVIIAFYRGSWCPYCNAQLNNYQQNLAEFKSKGATLVAITPEKPDLTTLTESGKKLDFQILTDKDNAFAKKLGLVFSLTPELKELYKKFGIDLEKSQGNSEWDLPVPATYVVSKAGKIIYAFVDVDYTQRASSEEILAALASAK